LSHLALILNVSVRDLERWIAGNERAPAAVFNAAVDLIQDIGHPPSPANGKKKPGP
jgi:succinate dehydrogenase flavin-adding protein (antitoxin of CptAB toxin-antitoxin module)